MGRGLSWCGVLVGLALAGCSKPRAKLEVERQVTIVSPPPAGLTLPPQAPGVIVGGPAATGTASPPSTVPAPTALPAPSRPSGWVRGEKR